MSKDYIHRIKGSSNRYRTSTVSRKRRSLITFWLSVLLVAVLVLSFVLGLYELRHHHRKTMPLEQGVKNALVTPEPTKSAVIPNNATTTTSLQGAVPIRFDFYQMLPKQSVGLTDLSAPINTKANLNQQYLLQIATLSNEGDALEMKNDLQKRGFQPSVMTVHRGDRTLYRIQIGPFNDEASANKIYQQLKLQNIDSIFLTVQGN